MRIRSSSRSKILIVPDVMQDTMMRKQLTDQKELGELQQLQRQVLYLLLSFSLHALSHSTNGWMVKHSWISACKPSGLIQPYALGSTELLRRKLEFRDCRCGSSLLCAASWIKR